MGQVTLSDGSTHEVAEGRPSVFGLSGRTWGGRPYWQADGRRHFALSGSAQYATRGDIVRDGDRLGLIESVRKSVGPSPGRYPTWWAAVRWLTAPDRAIVAAEVQRLAEQSAERLAGRM